MKSKILALCAAFTLMLAGCGEVPAVKVGLLTLDHISETLVVGDELQLNVTVEPENATNKEVTWSTGGDEGVVSVSEEGMVKALKAGSATVTATAKDGSGVNVTCAINVEDPVYPEGTFQGAAGTFQLVIAMGNKENQLVSVRFSNIDAVATTVAFDTHTKALEITTTGDTGANYGNLKFGKITATYDVANDKLVKVAFDGAVKDQIANNGQIEAVRAKSGDAAFFADCDGTSDELKAQFKRRYMSGSWQVDTTNENRFERDEEHFVSGTGAMKRKGWTGGAVAVNLGADFAIAKQVSNIHFWVYNPTDNANIKIRVWVYKAANFGSNQEVITNGFSIVANGWTYCSVGFTKAGVYNFQLADFTNSGAALTFDNIYLF